MYVVIQKVFGTLGVTYEVAPFDKRDSTLDAIRNSGIGYTDVRVVDAGDHG